MLLERCRTLCDAYNSLDVEPLIDILADDCVYESQKVLQPIVGKYEIIDFLRAKFETVRKSRFPVTCSVRKVVSGPEAFAIGTLYCVSTS